MAEFAGLAVERLNGKCKLLSSVGSRSQAEHRKRGWSVFPTQWHYLWRKTVLQFWFQKSKKEWTWQVALKFAPFRRKPQQQYPLTFIYTQQVVLFSNTLIEMCSTFSYQHWVLNTVSLSIRTQASFLRESGLCEKYTGMVKHEIQDLFPASHNNKVWQNAFSKATDICQGRRHCFPLLCTQTEPPEKSPHWPNVFKITK